MAISENTIRSVKYPPELLPDAWFGNVPASSEAAPPILDLKRFSPLLLELTNIQQTANANIILRARYDDTPVEQNTAAMLSGLVNAWRLAAKTQLRFNYFGVAPVANYTTHYGLWAYPAKVTHKLLWGIPLNDEEKAINEELSISDTVQKGLLPLPISQQIEREYPIMGEEPHNQSVNIAVANTVYPIEVMYPRPGELLVLTRIAAAPAAAANSVQIIVDRDNDANYCTFPTFPLSLVPGGEIACFIPATKEIRLSTTAAVAPGAHLFRYTIQRIKLTNILRVRFGLMTKAEAPTDLWKKVQGGIV